MAKKGDMIAVLVDVLSVNGTSITFSPPTDTFNLNWADQAGPISVINTYSSAAATGFLAFANQQGTATITESYNSGPSTIGSNDMQVVSFWNYGDSD